MSFSSWWKRKYVKLYSKIVREKASPQYIARGWAIGMFYGCVIPFGLQLICSVPTAFLLRGSKVGATVGTLITNHFSIFVIYPCQCYVGAMLMGKGRSFAHIQNAMQKVIQEQSYDALLAIGSDLTIAFFLGGFLLAAIMTPLTYWGVMKMVLKHRAHSEKKREKRLALARKKAEERAKKD